MAAGIAGWVFWEAQRVIRADAASLKARHLLMQWSSGAAVPASPQQVSAVREALQSALAITPDDPSLQEQLGDSYMVSGRLDWNDEALRRQHFLDAERQYRKALALRPTDPQTWASLAAAYEGLGDTGPRMHRAWEEALRLGPNEGHVQPMLLDMVLATWPTASPTMKRWAETLFESGTEPQRTSHQYPSESGTDCISMSLRIYPPYATAEAARPDSPFIQGGPP